MPYEGMGQVLIDGHHDLGSSAMRAGPSHQEGPGHLLGISHTCLVGLLGQRFNGTLVLLGHTLPPFRGKREGPPTPVGQEGQAN